MTGSRGWYHREVRKQAMHHAGGNMNPKMIHTSLVAAFLTGAPLMALASTQDDSCLETWKLRNFQPKSSTAGQLVESTSYHGRTTVILLLASW